MPSTPLSSFSPLPIGWLWPDYLPLGHLTLLLGNTGKTSLALDLAARLSTASPFPPLPATPTASPAPPRGDSLFLIPTLADASPFRNRAALAAPAADLSRIHLLADLPSLTHDDLPASLEPLTNLALLIIDPITSFLPRAGGLAAAAGSGGGPDAPAARNLLFPHLARLAQRFNIAILLTATLPRRFPASIDTPQFLARALRDLPYLPGIAAVHALLPSTQLPFPNESPPLASILVPLKTPAPTLPPPLRFTFNRSLTWEVAQSASLHLPRDPVLQNAILFLADLLRDGPLFACAITDAAQANAIPRSTLNRAKVFLGIRATRKRYGTPWYWKFPGDSRPLQSLATTRCIADRANQEMSIFGVSADS